MFDQGLNDWGLLASIVLAVTYADQVVVAVEPPYLMTIPH